ncbi:Lrp/AsnC family transcriptional regulator [Arthrobacter deserti]|uniref:Lrp/AsnC family transcriptional regulator n=1 Tax=Arthrobacter deserti TaxID=1742687 RepID=A0ABX1JIV1_9MICC|nr:Lrp/AsnC family transcriptional regulator [Arthrobacter deserti]
MVRGYRAEIDPEAAGRGDGVILDVEPTRFDRGSVYRFEHTMAAYEAFLTGQVPATPGIRKVGARFTMETIKG